MQRPVSGPEGNMKKIVRFAKWADFIDIPVEFGSLLDLATNPDLLNNYALAVFVGHSEYWSKNMRDGLDRFVQKGRNAMILSGNTMWWQVRFEGDQIVGYKANSTDDPLYGVNDQLVTGHWFEEPVNDPENRSIGVSFRNAGYVDAGSPPGGGKFYPKEEGYGGYTIVDGSHWLFDGTGLEDGDTFGIQYNQNGDLGTVILGPEVDGALFEWIDDKPMVTGEDGTPSYFEILGHAPAGSAKHNLKGHATMGLLDVPGGGTVFNAATMGWVEGLWIAWNTTTNELVDPVVSRITQNAIERLSATTVVPTPTALWMGMLLFAGMVSVGTRRK